MVLKLKLTGTEARILTLLQSDCVVLKSIIAEVLATANGASIGLCGIEIITAMHMAKLAARASIGLCGIEI